MLKVSYNLTLGLFYATIRGIEPLLPSGFFLGSDYDQPCPYMAHQAVSRKQPPE